MSPQAANLARRMGELINMLQMIYVGSDGQKVLVEMIMQEIYFWIWRDTEVDKWNDLQESTTLQWDLCETDCFLHPFTRWADD